jgi:phage terminase large subunit-like protein
MAANQVREDLIPPDGGDVLAVSLNASLSIHVQRAEVRKYLPPGTEWRNPSGPGISTAVLPNGRKIIFITNDAGRRAAQGFGGICMVWIDEEGDEDVFNELIARVFRYRWDGRSGYVVVTMTPLRGLGSWTYRRFIEEPAEGTRVHYIHGGDNPFIDQTKRSRLLKSYGEHERAARDLGEFTALEGLVYPFDPRTHVIPGFSIPSSWPRLAGLDWGTRNPCSYVLAAHDPADDTLHIYAAIHEPDLHLSKLAAKIRAINDVWPEWIVADSEDRTSRLTMSRDHDIHTSPARKGPNSVRAGVSMVAELLEPDANGRPHLFIHDNAMTRPIVKEFLGYRWDTTTSKRTDQPDRPMKRNDHSMDSIRYLVMKHRRSNFGAG